MTPQVSREFTAGLIAQLPALRRYARAMVGNAAAADDLVQDGIERALIHAATLRQNNQIGAWLRRIMHNLHMDELRRRRVRGVPVSTDEMIDDAALSTPPSAGGATGDVVSALGTLSVEHRRILVLAGIEGLSYREIAEELDVPLGTVMSRLARARAALRTAMGDAA